jgi:ribonuclease G
MPNDPMSSELLVNVTPQETRVAIIENGVTQEIYVERAAKRGLVGNIYKGRVSRVLPGMQAAFVDIGLERAAFLHAADVVSPNRQHSMLTPSVMPAPRAAPTAVPGSESANVGEDTTRVVPTTTESISDLLSEGQSILVQVIKDPLGTKGARLTTYMSIPSFYLVFVPLGEGVGISQRIEEESERDRLRSAVESIVHEPTGETPPDVPQSRPLESPRGGGYIVRTAADSIAAEKLSADVRFLRELWVSISEAAARSSAPALVHEDLPLVVRTMRELIGNEIERVRIDSRESFRRVVDFAEQFTPQLRDRVEHYPGERPIFDLYGVEDEIKKALDRRVQLKSGGYLIIDQTEAMTTIDVNTGGYVGRRNLEETIFKTNMEAANAIARQLRLRNLGGIIIIDFIDMNSEDHKRQVLRVLERTLERDPVKTQISEVSTLGLVQMTRKRTRESLEHVLCDTCPTCDGRGIVKSPETVCYEIFREILREARQYDTDQLLVLASQEVVDRLVDEESASLAELEAFIKRPIRLQVEPMYTQAQYDVVLM